MSSPVTAQLILIQGDADSFQQVIELENTARSIGRAQNCDIIWGSLQISRKHATLEYMVPKWYIRDTSTNGLSVNGIKLVKGELFPLKDTDIISFIPTGAVRYRFRYVEPSSPMRGAAPANNANARHQQLIPISPRPSTSSAALASCSNAINLNRDVVTSDRTDSRPSVELIGDGNESDSSNHSESLLSVDAPDDYFSFSGDENARLRSPSPLHSDVASGSSGPTLTKRKHKVDSSDDSDNNTARRKKKRGLLFTSSSSDEDDSIKSDPNVPAPSSIFKTLRLPKVKKNTNNNFISDEQISKIDDPETLRDHLRECMTKLKTTEVNLKTIECERAMEREDLRQKELDARSVNAAFKEETYKKILEVMDTELSCSVCNEVFIQATVIDCGHTFCHFCINEWARKKTECPICRKNFRNRSRHIEIENFINKMFESFSAEITTKRKISIREREEQAKKALEDARAAATENQQRQAGGNFHAFMQTTAERYVDFLAELHQINEILAPRGTNGRGGNATNNAERRRSARIQDRVIDAVVAGAAGNPPPPPVAVPTRGRAQRGRGRAAAPHLLSNAATAEIAAVTARAAEAARHVPNIPVVTLNDTVDDGQGGMRFPNQFMNYVRRLPIPQINLMREPRNGAGP